MRPGYDGGPTPKRRMMLTASLAAMLLATGAARAKTWGPENTVTIVDPSPVNWLSITWNTMEEPLRVDQHGVGQPTLATKWTWTGANTVLLTLRDGIKYQDGTPFTAANMKTAYDKVQDVTNPHPPGAFLNFARNSKMEVVDAKTIRMTFPDGDGAAMMKLRGMHVPSDAFWANLGFVDLATKTAEGHW